MKYEFTVSKNQSGQRLDKLLGELLSEQTSRSQLKKNGKFFLETDEGLVEQAFKSKVQAGQKWQIKWTEKALETAGILPWNTDMEILAETNDFLCVNKPVGVSVHPSESERSHKTVVNFLVHTFGNNFVNMFEAGTVRPGIVHRLDKITSGVLLVAKNKKTWQFLQENWQENTQKIYYAVVKGMPPKSGNIKSGIMRDPINRQKMMTSNSPKARPAHTSFERVAESVDGKYSLLKVQIFTGRTHQIRVHLAAIGFAIVGDERYGGENAKRVFLHAQSLGFINPETKKEMVVQAGFPADFLKKFNFSQIK